MDAPTVLDLARAGETLTVEFKRRRSKNDFTDNDLVEAVACLANGSGGVLLVGVEDGGSVSGCSPWHADQTISALLQALIQNRTRPSLATHIEVVDVDGKEVVSVEVPNSTMPIGTNRGVYRRRALTQGGRPECIAYEPHDLLLSQFSAAGRDWAELPALAASFDDLDATEFERFRGLCRSANGDDSLADLADEEILRALGLVDISRKDVPTLGAILLFGTEESIARWIPNHEIAFQVLEQTRLKTNDIFRAPLFKAAQLLQERLDARNVEDELQWGLIRLALPRIPASVAREAIANALVHRDYTALGMIGVSLSDDIFSVTSPGGLPRGVTLENLLFASQPRSRALADAFKRAGLVERSGRGISIMYRDLLRLGRHEPDYSRTTDQRVVVAFPIERADTELVTYVHRLQDAGNPLGLTELRVLHVLRVDGSLTIGELADELALPKSQLRSQLNGMTERGIVEARGEGRIREFHLPPTFYQTAGRPADYTRSAPTDPLRREDMVLRFVRDFGKISRSEAADLCGLPPEKASHLLRSMRVAGLLEMHGERRWAAYVLPNEN